MDDYLTVRQVQNLLKVDRITIYRMLRDGRLKGSKIGQQWRFQAREVEALLSGFIEVEDQQEPASASNFPTHCVEAVQNVFAMIAQVGCVTIDREGNCLTGISNPCKFCALIQSTPTGLKACQQSWAQIANDRQKDKGFFSCHAGLQYARSPVNVDGKTIAFVLAGQFYSELPDANGEAQRIGRLAETYQVDFTRLAHAAREIAVLSDSTRSSILPWSVSVAEAIDSILRERAGLVGRLQKIAEISTISL